MVLEHAYTNTNTTQSTYTLNKEFKTCKDIFPYEYISSLPPFYFSNEGNPLLQIEVEPTSDVSMTFVVLSACADLVLFSPCIADSTDNYASNISV